MWENGGGSNNKHNKHNKHSKKKGQVAVDGNQGVYVGTAHQSKGLEWKVVFVVRVLKATCS